MAEDERSTPRLLTSPKIGLVVDDDVRPLGARFPEPAVLLRPTDLVETLDGRSSTRNPDTWDDVRSKSYYEAMRVDLDWLKGH